MSNPNENPYHPPNVFQPKRPWKFHTNCPKCTARIGMIHGAKQATPGWIACPRCGITLRIVGGKKWIAITFGVFTAIPFLGLGLYGFYNNSWLMGILGFVGMMAVYAATEFLLGLFIYTYAQFVPLDES